MKNPHLSFRLARAAVLLLSLCLPVAARAQFPLTANGNGNNASRAVQWYISDNVLPNNAVNPPNGGLGFSDAEFSNGTLGLDAYDGAFAMRINGASGGYFVAPPSATLSGNLFDSGVVASNGFTVQVKYTFFQNLPIVRAIYSFTGTANTSLNLSWDSNLGSDSTTTVLGTSTGNQPAINAVNDRWFVSSDNGAHGDLINTMVRYGTNFIQRPQADSIVPAGGTDLLADHYSLSLTNGENKKLMMFGVLGALSDGGPGAVTSAALFDNYQSMMAAGLFSGTSADLQNIVNWGVVPEPTTGSLVAIGFAILFLRRGKRAEKRI